MYGRPRIRLPCLLEALNAFTRAGRIEHQCLLSMLQWLFPRGEVFFGYANHQHVIFLYQKIYILGERPGSVKAAFLPRATESHEGGIIATRVASGRSRKPQENRLTHDN